MPAANSSLLVRYIELVIRRLLAFVSASLVKFWVKCSIRRHSIEDNL